MRLFACLLFSLPVLVACQASLKADAKVSTNANAREFDEPLEPGAPDDGPGFGDDPQDEALDENALSGARLDLQLANEQPTPSCTCLAVHLGHPSDPAFLWQTTPPRVDLSQQLVIALGSDGIACPSAPKDSLGASYWGYQVHGDDIVVYVENARFGRPVTRGAVIPRPAGSGRVLIRPRDKSVPFGAGPGGRGDCVVGAQTNADTTSPSAQP